MNKTLKLKSKNPRKKHYKKIKSQKGGSWFSDLTGKIGSFKNNAFNNLSVFKNNLTSSFSNMRSSFKSKMCASIGGKKTRRRR